MWSPGPPLTARLTPGSKEASGVGEEVVEVEGEPAIPGTWRTLIPGARGNTRGRVERNGTGSA